MATNSAATALTLLELAKRTDPQGKLLTIAEVLHNTNMIMGDIPWMEANGTTSHKAVRRTALPTGTWRRLNQGVAREATQTEPIEEPMGILEAFSTPDKKLIDIAPDPKGQRMQEARGFIEGMGQNLINKMFYGDSGLDPEQFDGLAPRQATLQTGAKRTTIGAGGTGSDLMSIYAVEWGPGKVYGIYPRGSRTVGIKHTDMGTDIVLDGSSNDYIAYRDHFEFNGGLCVEDPRCIGRIANIESTGSSNIFDEDLLIELLNNMYMGGKNAKLYVNRTTKTQMEIKLKDKANVNFTVQNGLGGEDVLFFKGRPVRLVDEILITETAIS